MTSSPDTKEEEFTYSYGCDLAPVLDHYKPGLEELRIRLENCEKTALFKEILAPEDTEMILLRFLTGKHNDVDAAWDAFERSMEWRNNYKSHLVPDMDDEQFEKTIPYGSIVREHIPELHFAGFSRAGLPCQFELKGRTDVVGILKKLSSEEYSQYFAWQIIASYRKLNKLSREQGKFLAVCLVICCKNVTMTHMKFLPYFKHEVDGAQLTCPEYLGNAIAVNLPWFFNMLWTIVKPWLDKRTLEKVQVLTGNTSEQDLQKLVDPKYIPTLIGGDNAYPKLVIPDPTKGMAKQDLAAGKKFSLELPASKANLTISWRWSPIGKDVGFSATFIDEEGTEDQVVDYAKMSATGEVYDGTFLTSRAGKLRFEWDNSYSMFTGKSFMYFVGEFEELQVIS